MDYQSVDDRSGGPPTSDWRDEQWVLGQGLYVNALVHGYLKVLGLDERAERFRMAANREDGRGFATQGQPTYALWFYKVFRYHRCDLLGNSLAILTGLAGPDRARDMVARIQAHWGSCGPEGNWPWICRPAFSPMCSPRTPTGIPVMRSTTSRATTTMAASGPLSAASTSPRWWQPVSSPLRKRSSWPSPPWCGLPETCLDPSRGLRLQRMVPRPGRHPCGSGLADLVRVHVPLCSGLCGGGTALFSDERPMAGLDNLGPILTQGGWTA